MLQRKFLFLTIICFIFLFLATSYQRSDTTLKRMEQEVLAKNVTGVYKGNIAENFSLLNNKGELVTLNGFKGKKVILNFFSTWCAPCQEEMPTLVELDRRLSNEKFVLLGINVTSKEGNPNHVQKFIDHYQIKYDILFDGEEKVLKKYQLIGIPTTLFIDEKGKIVERINGMISEEMIKDHVFFEKLIVE